MDNRPVQHPGHIEPAVLEGELIDPRRELAEPELCDDCGHFHRPGSWHPATRNQACGSYLCCQP